MKNILIILLILIFTPKFASSNEVRKAVDTINKWDSNFINYKAYTNHYYSYKTNKKRALIIVTGVAEPAIKYWTLFDQFSEHFDLFFWDHIGHGKSPDLIKSIDSKKVYIDDFEAYQETFNNFINKIKINHTDINVISHSFGSHVIVRQLLKHPKSINKIIAVTPFIDVKKYFIPNWLSKFVLNNFYKPTDWAPLQSDKNPNFSYFTSSKENFENYRLLLNKHFPDQLTTGVTAGWLTLAISSIEDVLTSNYKQIDTPILLFTAGKDKIVDSKAAINFCSQLPKCKNIHYKKGKHQLLLETDDILNDIHAKIKNALEVKL